MAVYTQLGAEALAGLIAHFDVGALVSAKGIAEGVSNSNWLIETSGAGCAAQDGAHCRFILTVYEARTEVADLPFFLGLLDHLAAKHCPVPRTIHDRAGQASRMVAGKPAALIEFLPGLSVSEPTPAQARAVGDALAHVHLASADFAGTRANGLGLAQWGELLRACGPEGLASIHPELGTLVTRLLDLSRDAFVVLDEGVINRMFVHGPPALESRSENRSDEWRAETSARRAAGSSSTRPTGP